MTTALHQLSASEIARRVRSGDVSARRVTEACLERTRVTEPRVHAFLAVLDTESRRLADHVDDRVARGEDPGPLAGVPVAIKDNICLDGAPTTCASRLLEEWVSPYNATVVDKLLDAGAVPIGKTNLDEFAMGSSGENSAFESTRNPWDLERVPGGSSAGSAAAVAARNVPVALGSDTGGSVRQPGGLCGVVAMKPTYGRVSRYGLVAFASSLDQIGPLARSVEDTRLLLKVIAGHDERDSTSAPGAGEWRPSTAGDTPRLGVPTGLLERGLDPHVTRVMETTIDRWRAMGATIESVEIPEPDYAVAAYYIISGAEASSNLARYDGVRYGRRRGDDGLRALYEATRTTGFGAEVKRRIMIGTYVLSAGYYDAYYLKAQRVRAWLRRALDEVLARVDAILMPTSPTVAFRAGEKLGDPLAMYLSDVFTIPVNLAGLPALSLPAGFSPEGLPVGVQLVGRHWEEETLLDLAGRLEGELAVEIERSPVIPGVER